MSLGNFVLGLLAIFLPFISVWIKSGFCTADYLVNVLLCMCGHIPGVIHAWYIIARAEPPKEKIIKVVYVQADCPRQRNACPMRKVSN